MSINSVEGSSHTIDLEEAIALYVGAFHDVLRTTAPGSTLEPLTLEEAWEKRVKGRRSGQAQAV